TQASVIWDGATLKTIGVSGGSFSSFVAATDGTHTLAVSATNAAGTGTSPSQSVSVGVSSGGGSSSSSSGSSGSSSSTASTPAASVGPSGGTLATSDGTLTIAVPAGAVPAGATLTATTSATAPSDAPALPSGTATASPYVVLSGATPAQPLTATLKYSASALGGLPPQRLGVFADGIWHYLPTAVDAASGTVSASISGPGTIVILANTQQLSDVSATYWAATPIATLLGAQVVSGYPDGTFKPDAAVTRAEFVKMLDLTLGLTPGAGATAFSDVPASAWYAPYVAAAVQDGLIQGVSATAFAPDATMTREQVAVVLQRALKLSDGAALSYSDAGSVDAWAQSGVQAATAAGYLTGFPDGTFQPLGTTTRAQAAQVLAAVIAHMAP
ncbi:MAG TPA: S-layer homology domain-containing protein, partial [Bacillota bacterium]|nr:S-layer homology domain-containing protein [Bacillota bacterium]